MLRRQIKDFVAVSLLRPYGWLVLTAPYPSRSTQTLCLTIANGRDMEILQEYATRSPPVSTEKQDEFLMQVL